MANKVRGETTVEIGGVSHTISLCMGALAEIEDAFGVENFEEALDFTKISARKLRTFMLAVMKGNGIAITDEVKSGINLMNVPAFMAMLSELMDNSAFNTKTADSPGEGDAPLAAPSAGPPG